MILVSLCPFLFSLWIINKQQPWQKQSRWKEENPKVVWWNKSKYDANHLLKRQNSTLRRKCVMSGSIFGERNVRHMLVCLSSLLSYVYCLVTLLKIVQILLHIFQLFKENLNEVVKHASEIASYHKNLKFQRKGNNKHKAKFEHVNKWEKCRDFRSSK